jgi:putative heme-binding domain-containing protein
MTRAPALRRLQGFVKPVLAMVLMASLASLGNALQAPSRPGKGSAGNQAGPARGRGRGTGQVFPDPTASLVKQMLADADKDHDKKLSREEFMALAEDWYDRIDPDRRGQLSQPVFVEAFARLMPVSEQGFGIQFFLAPGFFAACDLDKDGLLTRDELRQTFATWFDKWAGPSGGLTEAKLQAGLRTAWPMPRFGGGGGRSRLGAQEKQGADFSPKSPLQPKNPADEARHFLLPKGYRLEPVLAEPDIAEPVAAVFDGNGRLYVAEMRTYMQNIDGRDQHVAKSRVSRHESTKHDGVYDKHTVFIDNLVLPRFILPLDKSVLVMETDADDIYEYWDTDGDGVADKKQLWFHGAGRRGNLEHQQSGMVWGLDNWIYTTMNAFRLRWTPTGVLKETTAANGGQWGLTQDDDGKMWFVDAGGERGPVNFQQPIVYGAFQVSGQMEEGFDTVWPASGGIADMQGGMMRIRMPDKVLNHFTAACGQDVFRGHRLPEDLRGDLLFAEPVGRLVRRTKVIVSDGLTQLKNAYPKSEFIRSTDQLFRPVNMTTAPDGTLFVVDMYRGIIQESTWVEQGSYLRRKVEQYQLDKLTSRGRIWRLRYEGIEPDYTWPHMLDETPAQLVSHLEHPNGWWRDTAQRLLILRQDKSVTSALQQLARSPSNPLARMHALWTLEGLGTLDAALVRETIKDANPRLRVQAIRLSESLIKAGDKALLVDVQAMAKDRDPSVVIQSLMTLNLQKAPKAPAQIRAAMNASRSRGVREIGSQILQPPDAMGGFALLRFTPQERKTLERGAGIYKELCFTCHGADGRGTPLAGAAAGITQAPPLAGSSRVLGHKDGVVHIVLHGLIGPVDGRSYPSLMAPMGSNNDEWVASIASYIRNNFGNSGSFVAPEEVAKVRSAAAGRNYPWTIEELQTLLPGFLRYRPDWKVAASAESVLAHFGINGSGFIRWDAGEPQKPGQWFQIELPEPARLSEIQLDSPPSFPPGSPGSFPRGFKVEVSTDGKSWMGSAEGKGTGSLTRIPLQVGPAKMIRISLTESAGELVPAWSIQKVRLFEAVKEPDGVARAPRVGRLPVPEVVAAVERAHGDANRGRKLFTELSCVACHTTRADEPPKGPFLGKTATTLSRHDIVESILLPSKVIAEGYGTVVFTLSSGKLLEGFIVRETPDAVVIRTSAAEEHTIPIKDIEERSKSPKSLMPEGLAASLTISDLASLVDYVQSLAPAGGRAPNRGKTTSPKDR